MSPFDRVVCGKWLKSNFSLNLLFSTNFLAIFIVLLEKHYKLFEKPSKNICMQSNIINLDENDNFIHI